MTNIHLKHTILGIVETQLRENDPPETRQTLERLLAAGYERPQAIEMIGTAVVEEIWNVLKRHEPYDPARYLAALDRLGREPARRKK